MLNTLLASTVAKIAAVAFSVLVAGGALASTTHFTTRGPSVEDAARELRVHVPGHKDEVDESDEQSDDEVDESSEDESADGTEVDEATDESPDDQEWSDDESDDEETDVEEPTDDQQDEVDGSTGETDDDSEYDESAEEGDSEHGIAVNVGVTLDAR